MLRAAFECLKMRNERQVLDSFIVSERIYQDMILATEKIAREKFHENFVIREFFEIDVDMEFRGICFFLSNFIWLYLFLSTCYVTVKKVLFVTEN
jgi:hypothetical protein